MAGSEPADRVDALFAHEPRQTAEIILTLLYDRRTRAEADPEWALLRADLEAVVFRHGSARALRIGDRKDCERLGRYLATAEALGWPQEFAVTGPLGPRLRALVARGLRHHG